mgnify:FL=1
MSSGESERVIVPFALVDTGLRWHVRAFCHKRGEFRDFVLGRITATRNTRPSEVDVGLDADWHTLVTVVVEPNPALSNDQRAAIAAEYNMPRSHTVKLQLRKSMLFYLKARFSPQPKSIAVAHQLVMSEQDIG